MAVGLEAEMDLRKRSSVERWRREGQAVSVGSGSAGSLPSWRRICPPEFLLLGCCGLIAWVALLAWTGNLDRRDRGCGFADAQARACLPAAQPVRTS
jgi:hypothetical protein